MSLTGGVTGATVDADDCDWSVFRACRDLRRERVGGRELQERLVRCDRRLVVLCGLRGLAELDLGRRVVGFRPTSFL